MNGTLSTAALPPPKAAIFCSATPTSMKRSGNSFWNHSARVDSERSAHSTTTRPFSFPASTVPVPNPSRVGFWSISSANSFAESLAASSGILVRQAPAHGADFLEEPLPLFRRRRLAGPVIVEFDLGHALPRDRVGDDERGLLIDRFRFLDRAHEGVQIVPIDFDHVPIERA